MASVSLSESSAHQTAVNQALRACRPLSDPVMVLARWLQISALLPVAVMFGVVGPLVIRTLVAGGDMGPVLGVAVVMGVAMCLGLLVPAALYILVRSGRGESVLYLRSFRGDRQAARLRSLLKAALGSGVRLCGIRPPRQRVMWLSRLFLTNVTGFRYLGSESFELEAADRNWLARLLATCARSRFVFVDVRDVTPHVADEIRLALLNFGPERCVFITDESRPPQGWHGLIREMANLHGLEESNLRLLSYPGDAAMETDGEPQCFVEAVRALVSQMPHGPAQGRVEAVNFARTRVEGAAWRTSWLETDWAQVLGAFVLGTGLGFVPALLPTAWQSAAQGIIVTYTVAVVLVVLWAYFAAWGRAWRQARVSAPLRVTWAEGNPKTPLRISLLLMFLGIGSLGLSAAAIPVFNQVKLQGMATKSLALAKQIGLACKLYAGDNDGEFPPSLDALGPDYFNQRQRLVSPFAPDEPVGYVYYPGSTETSDPNAILLEDKFSPKFGRRIIIHADNSGEIKRIR